MVFTDLAKAIEYTINIGVQMGGVKIEEDHYQARKAICENCPNWGKVNLLGLETDGCTICGCPTATKPKWKEYFSFTKQRKVQAVCPDDINRWETVDNNFFN